MLGIISMDINADTDILKQYIDSLKLKELIQIEFKDETDFILKSEKKFMLFILISRYLEIE